MPAADFDLEDDKEYIVSVGSVGQPRDFDNRASYTVYDTDQKRFEFKRIEYDIELAADKVLRARLERNFAHRLFIGVCRSKAPMRARLGQRPARTTRPDSARSRRRPTDGPKSGRTRA